MKRRSEVKSYLFKFLVLLLLATLAASAVACGVEDGELEDGAYLYNKNYWGENCVFVVKGDRIYVSPGDGFKFYPDLRVNMVFKYSIEDDDIISFSFQKVIIHKTEEYYSMDESEREAAKAQYAEVAQRLASDYNGRKIEITNTGFVISGELFYDAFVRL